MSTRTRPAVLRPDQGAAGPEDQGRRVPAVEAAHGEAAGRSDGCGTDVAQRALQQLAADGLTERRPGTGYWSLGPEDDG